MKFFDFYPAMSLNLSQGSPSAFKPMQTRFSNVRHFKNQHQTQSELCSQTMQAYKIANLRSPLYQHHLQSELRKDMTRVHPQLDITPLHLQAGYARITDCDHTQSIIININWIPNCEKRCRACILNSTSTHCICNQAMRE